MTNLAIHQFIACRDNFGMLLHDPDAGVDLNPLLHVTHWREALCARSVFL